MPAVDPALAFVLSAMVGHLFGYEAALAIDAQALPLRSARAVVEASLTASVGPAGGGRVSDIDGDRLIAGLRPGLAATVGGFFEGLRAGSYNGHLEAGTAVGVSTLLRYAAGALPIEGYEAEYGKVGTPSALVEDLLEALTAGIDELTRPVDAIKHQAKTVTVGISRSEDVLFRVGLVQDTIGRRGVAGPPELPGAADPVGARRLGGDRSTASPGTASKAASPPGRPSTWWTRAASPPGSRRGPTGTRSCGVPSTGRPRNGRSRWPGVAATAGR